MNRAEIEKVRARKPQSFQNGFVANRIARGEATKYPDADITVIPIRYGKGRIFVIRKIEGNSETYFVSPNDGFLPLPGTDNADPMNGGIDVSNRD